MKLFNFFAVFLMFISLSCKGQETQQSTSSGSEVTTYESFGGKINTNGAITADEMAQKYEGLQVADTLAVKFTGKVTKVCKAKGCWMTLEMPNGEETMVRFKDYGFFMPKDIEGREVIVNGLAFVEEMSVEDQRHYAKDGGKSAEEISQIVTPKKTLGFEADGVLLKQ